jgi:hypothetical protein
VVVDGVIEPVEDEQLARIALEEGFVAQALLDVGRVRINPEVALGDDIAFLVAAIDPFDSLGIHQIGGVPAA